MPNECNDLIPSMCGGSRLPTFVDASCFHVHFTGITDVTVAQGDTIDLTEGVHAYDGNGNEIAYTYTPTSIDTSVIGEYEVVYRASGEGDVIKPMICGDTALHINGCGHEVVVKYRTITVESTGAKVCTAKVCESSIAC